jgi:hypothetical protein
MKIRYNAHKECGYVSLVSAAKMKNFVKVIGIDVHKIEIPEGYVVDTNYIYWTIEKEK